VRASAYKGGYHELVAMIDSETSEPPPILAEIRKGEDWEAAVTAVSKSRPQTRRSLSTLRPVTLSRRKAAPEPT
jgi:hypothetical protein